MNTDGALTYSASAVSEVSAESGEDTIRPRDFINIDEVKIESKDHMWRPAPIIGREFTTRVVQEGDFPINQHLSSLRGPLQNNYMAQSYRTISDTDSFSMPR
mgnify:CR=1 FL=1